MKLIFAVAHKTFQERRDFNSTQTPIIYIFTCVVYRKFLGDDKSMFCLFLFGTTSEVFSKWPSASE